MAAREIVHVPREPSPPRKRSYLTGSSTESSPNSSLSSLRSYASEMDEYTPSNTLWGLSHAAIPARRPQGRSLVIGVRESVQALDGRDATVYHRRSAPMELDKSSPRCQVVLESTWSIPAQSNPLRALARECHLSLSSSSSSSFVLLPLLMKRAESCTPIAPSELRLGGRPHSLALHLPVVSLRSRDWTRYLSTMSCTLRGGVAPAAGALVRGRGGDQVKVKDESSLPSLSERSARCSLYSAPAASPPTERRSKKREASIISSLVVVAGASTHGEQAAEPADQHPPR